MKKLLTSRLAMKWSGQKLETSSANKNVFSTKTSLDVRGDKIGNKDFANLQVGVPIVDKIGLNFGQLLITGLWTFELPYKIPGLEPLG